MLERLNAYYEKGLVYKQVHPSLPLVIWNYSEKVQYEGLWDELTLMCRGLITDNTGKVIVKPFGKFFNYEEVESKGLVPWSTSEYVYIHYGDIWPHLENIFHIGHNDIKSIIEVWLEDTYKLKGVRPIRNSKASIFNWEELTN
jgi:hypothetical protein